MTNLKRYDLRWTTRGGQTFEELTLDDEGEWIRFEDAHAELERLRAEIRALDLANRDALEKMDLLTSERDLARQVLEQVQAQQRVTAGEIERLRDENAICRSAIEDAVLLVDGWVADDANDSDIDQGAGRATLRMLSEAIGKATPRLLMERPEGQKLYGLRWRELREENERLQHAFKNFHRMLCERFDYVHDEKDWERDQVSLMEWIARKRAPEPMTTAKAVSAEDIRDAVAWLARHAKGMNMEGWQDVSSTLLAAAEIISRLRADAEGHNSPSDEPLQQRRIRIPPRVFDIESGQGMYTEAPSTSAPSAAENTKACAFPEGAVEATGGAVLPTALAGAPTYVCGDHAGIRLEIYFETRDQAEAAKRYVDSLEPRCPGFITRDDGTRVYCGSGKGHPGPCCCVEQRSTLNDVLVENVEEECTHIWQGNPPFCFRCKAVKSGA